MSVKLLTEHNLEFICLSEGCTDSSEATLVKMPHYWKSHVAAHFSLMKQLLKLRLHMTTVRQQTL